VGVEEELVQLALMRWLEMQPVHLQVQWIADRVAMGVLGSGQSQLMGLDMTLHLCLVLHILQLQSQGSWLQVVEVVGLDPL
jgi:hypothetical protein